MKGMTVQLVVKTQDGTDAFGAPIYTETIFALNTLGTLNSSSPIFYI